MYEDIKRFLSGADTPPPQELYALVSRRIRQTKIRQAKIKYYRMLTVVVAAIVALIPTYRYMVAQMTHTGFVRYLSLATDSAALTQYGKEFAFSLAESLPVTAVILMLSIILVLVGSSIITLNSVKRLRLIATFS